MESLDDRILTLLSEVAQRAYQDEVSLEQDLEQAKKAVEATRLPQPEAEVEPTRWTVTSHGVTSVIERTAANLYDVHGMSTNLVPCVFAKTLDSAVILADLCNEYTAHELESKKAVDEFREKMQTRIDELMGVE